MARAKKIKLSKLQETVAKNLVKYIEDQKSFIERSENTVTESLLGGGSSSYDLRQNIQCLETAKNTLHHLLTNFEEHVGVAYEAYCDANKIEKINSPIEDLTSAVKELITKLAVK